MTAPAPTAHDGADAPGLNLAAAFRAVARAVPERDCLVADDGRRTWAAVDAATDRVAGLLHAHGLGCRTERDGGALAGWECGQSVVALYLYNSPEYLEAMVGAYKARCAPANVNFRSTPTELAYVLADMRADAVVCHASLGPTLDLALASLADGQRPGLVLVVEDRPAAERTPLALPGAVDYAVAVAAATPLSHGPVSPDDLYVLYTGGTTGRPKGVLWRQADFAVGALGFTTTHLDDVAAGALRGADRRVLPAPPFMHGAAQWFTWSAWLAGGTVVLPEDPRRVHPADLVATVVRERVGSLQVVGDAMARPLLDHLLAHPDVTLPSLRFLVSGGAPLSPTVKAALITRLPGLSVIDIMGSSESGRIGVATTRDAASASTGAFDPSAGGTVLDEALTGELPPGSDEVGWLARSGAVPLGYLGDPERTARTFPVVHGVRFAVPGDRARRRTDGAVEVLGRDAATINTGGEKVYAEEVELALLAHPAVADVLVVGRPSERWGQEVVAVVALRPGHEHVDDGSLREACTATLSGYKCPKAFVRVAEVRRTPSGKPDYAWARVTAAG